MTHSVSIYDRDGQVRPLEEIETEIIAMVLATVAGNMSEAARCLKIGRSTIYRKVSAEQLRDLHDAWDAAGADGQHVRKSDVSD